MPYRYLITNTEYDRYTGTVTDSYTYEWTARDGTRIRTTVTVCDVGRSCDVAALASTSRRDALEKESLPGYRDYRMERRERAGKLIQREVLARKKAAREAKRA
jgi:hypothetical protein